MEKLPVPFDPINKSLAITKGKIKSQITHLYTHMQRYTRDV
jgi:hypothetical protein